jgi:glycerol-3-phosphate dehydrogenase
MSLAPQHLHLDIAIIGGGVAGLWLANRCRSQGLQTALFESQLLGGEQSIASQGMIHGGMKYTLAGALTNASEAIADMPKHWRACLCGEGDVNLRHTRILSDHFFLWSSASLAAKVTSFLASKITRGRVEAVHMDRRPPLLRHPDFNGNLYRLEDIVIDTSSLIANLAHNIEGNCFQLDWRQARLHKDEQGRVSLELQQGEYTFIVHAQRFIFSAGKGNTQLLEELGLAQPAMQLRPLQQVMVKHWHPMPIYGHCLGTDTTPRLTISSHRMPDGAHIWYLGGSLAEKGASLPAEELIALAQAELRELIPWVNLEGAAWATHPVTRAEARQATLTRPDNAFITRAQGASNLLVGWPTKLTLAPNFAREGLALMEQDKLVPQADSSGLKQLRALLPIPAIAKTPWELAFPPALPPEETLERRFRSELYEDDEENY